MAGYNGISKRVKNALIALLQTVTYDTGSGAEAAFSAVLDSTAAQANTDQTAEVLPGDVTNERQTSAESDRVLSYIVRIRLALEDTATSMSSTVDRMYDLTDLVIDVLDNADQHSTLADTNGPIGTYLMQASRGDWYVAEANSGSTLICDINVALNYSHNL